jgi:hypothetical protein
MRVLNQWHFGVDWGIALFSIFRTEDFCGFVILGCCFEWPLTDLGVKVHETMKERGLRH